MGRPILVSITVPVSHLEPLAVLDAIADPDQPHFFAERPDRELALAAAEPVAEWSGGGQDRFQKARFWMDRLLADAIAVGPVDPPFGGPTFLCSFTFEETSSEPGPFPEARVFVPRWLVARSGGAAVAVASVCVTAELDPDSTAERILRAQEKFQRFMYREAGDQPGLASGWIEAGGTPQPAFESAVAAAVACIQRGEFEKIVLARRLRIEATEPLRPLTVVDRLRRRYPSCWTLAVGSGTGETFVAATPERLVRVQGGQVETAAIAGTAPRADGVADDARLARELLESDKNLHEHRLVIASIERRLRQVGVEPSTPASPRLMTLATVQHLHTPITGRLPGGRHLLELVEALHPTPAMGGRPRDVVLPRLREFETFERGLYAGPMGWVRHDGEGEFVVGIRAGVLRGRQAELYAGVGIVSGSDPAGEWRETEWKLAAMRDALGGHAR